MYSSKLLRKGCVAKTVAQKFGVSEATVTRIKKDGDKLLNADGTRNKHCVDSRSEKIQKMDQFLSQWVRLYREKGFPISGPIICRKAAEINDKFNIYESFKVCM